jgi:hypothetical protein
MKLANLSKNKCEMSVLSWEIPQLNLGLSNGLTYKIEAGTDFFWEGPKGYTGTDISRFRRLFGYFNHFGHLICVFLSNLDWKLYKFDKKVIAIEKLDDYHNKFGYKD